MEKDYQELLSLIDDKNENIINDGKKKVESSNNESVSSIEVPKSSGYISDEDSRTSEVTNEATEKSKVEWYLQLLEGVIGPLSKNEIETKIHEGSADGMTYAWKLGMPEWHQIGQIKEFKDLIKNDDSGLCKRMRIDEVPERFKYITPDGIGKIYDSQSKTWMNFAQYQKLLDQDNLPKVDIDSKKAKNIDSRRKYRLRVKEKKQAGQWVKAKKNPNIYVTGLPLDALPIEVETFFKRAGVLKIDLDTGRSKIKLYPPAENAETRDALISYMNEVSVDFALKYINNTFFRDNKFPVHIEKAKFEAPQTVPEVKPVLGSKAQQAKKAQFLAARLEQRRRMGWSEGVSERQTKIMILKPLWTYEEAFHYLPKHSFYWTISSNLKEWFNSWTEVASVTPIERHPQGIVCVKFRDFLACETAIARLNEANFGILEYPLREATISYLNFLTSSRNDEKAIEKTKVDSTSSKFITQYQSLLSQEELFLKMIENAQDFTGLAPIQIGKRETSPKEKEVQFMNFVKNNPLQLEAYMYDGRTDFKNQVLPLVSAPPELERNIGSEEWQHMLEAVDSDDEEITIKCDSIDPDN